MVSELPEPLPGDAARLDQLAAQWRDTPPSARLEVEQAAAALRANPSPETGAALMDALRRAGISGDATPPDQAP
ncbi:hypothetical protein E1265_31260 [Streptomyces sp. 8K308]|uniref:hypothetical protein n=1 Tax=Streptomyces sp. 8K308 TaxID=2530388 RepID=UPI00104FA69B|nr:hypothetical protein [Streptomyces sp. 8K308]TDC10411.1 hypothetical protein E1265_31260 [Streptomyces sp. 8K308]